MIRILVSNTELPSKKIGSWTNRISKLIQEEPLFFDFILSPTTSPTNSHFNCVKKKWLPHFPRRFRSWEVLNNQAGQFVKAFKSLSLGTQPVQVLVMDDLVLLEAFALLKLRGHDFNLVYSFHGHSFLFPDSWSSMVNQVLFLTSLGYMETFQRHEVFTPLVSIVGNGVDSNLFFPLSSKEKAIRKRELGFADDSSILIWLSNNRPKKGFHLFQKLVEKLLIKYEKLEVLVIGTKQEGLEDSPRIHCLGKIANKDLPKYLQIGDFYTFTSLWKEGFGLSLAEAAKCGNQVIASKSGGIPEVVKGLPGAILIDQPNQLEAWEQGFNLAWSRRNDFVPDPSSLRDFHDLEDWKNKYLAALR